MSISLLRSRIGAAILMLVCLLMLTWSSATAQNPVTVLEQLQIALWPEYDRPAMLVIYRFRLPSDVQLPALIELPIPAEAGEPHAVAWQDADAGLFDASYTLVPVTGWNLVQILMEQSRLGQLEYYAELNFDGAQRSFEFHWPGTVELASFAYEVQQPIGAQQLQVEPGDASQGAGPFGMNYLNAELGPVAVDTTIDVQVRYQKDSTLLSIEALQPLSEPAPVAAEPGPTNLLPWALVGAGAILIAGGLFYYTRSRGLRPVPQQRRARARKAESTIEASAIFCHHCGEKAQVNDVFCRNCGTRLRKT